MTREFIINRLKRNCGPNKFSHLNRHQKALRKLMDPSEDFIGHLVFLGNNSITFNDKIFYVPIQPEEGKKRLGEVAHFSGNLSEIFTREETDIKDDYNLSYEEIINYRSAVNDILCDGDSHICGLLNIPRGNPFEVSDLYRRVLYYVAELCNKWKRSKG